MRTCRLSWISLFILCCVVLFVQPGSSDILPVYASGKNIHQITWVVKLQVGTIKKSIRAVVDRTGSKLTTTFPIDKVVSKSYSSYAGGSDIVLVGEKSVLFEHEVNPSLPSALGCSTCQAVLGIGAGSPIWLHFDKVLYTPGSIFLDESTDSFEYLTSGSGLVECELATPEICVTSGIIFGTTVRVVFGANEASLLLPPTLLNKYIDGKSLKKNPPGDWNDVKIKFPSIPGTGDNSELVIQREHLVSPSDGGGYHLLVDKSPLSDTVYIGRSARLNVMIEVDMIKSRAKVTSIQVSKHYSTAGLLAGIMVALIFEYWRQTPTGTWEDFNFASPYKIASVGITVVASVVIYSAEEYQSVLKPFPVANVYVGVMLFGSIVWNIAVILMYFTSTSRNVLGWVMKEKKGSLIGTMGENVESKENKGENVYINQAAMGSGGGNSVENWGSDDEDDVLYVPDNVRSRKKGMSATGRIDISKEELNRQKAMKKKNRKLAQNKNKSRKGIDELLLCSEKGGDVESIGNKGSHSEEAIYEKVYFNTRLWIVASVEMEKVLLVLTFLIVEETRAEALWGLAGSLFILYILYRLMYNAFIITTLSRGNRSFVWSGFIVYLCLVIIATLVVAQRYVVGPTVERLFTSEEFLAILGAVTLYLIILYWAVWAGISTVLIQDKKMAVFLHSQKTS